MISYLSRKNILQNFILCKHIKITINVFGVYYEIDGLFGIMVKTKENEQMCQTTYLMVSRDHD